MSIFGTKQNPAIVRVQTQERAYEISELCEKNGWQVIVGIEVDKPENIDDVLKLQRKVKPAFTTSASPARNAPCPCGSNKQYKRCCANKPPTPSVKDIEKLIEKVSQKLKQTFEGSNTTLVGHQGKRKYSDIFLSFFEPMFDIIEQSSDLGKTLELGVMIWNQSVAFAYPNHGDSDKLRNLFNQIYALSAHKKLIDEMIVRKRKEFGADDFFIARHAFEIDDQGHMSISVAVIPIEN